MFCSLLSLLESCRQQLGTSESTPHLAETWYTTVTNKPWRRSHPHHWRSHRGLRGAGRRLRMIHTR